MNLTFKPTPEDKLLLYCARTHMDAETKEKIKSIVLMVTDWDYVIEMATRHRLRHFLYNQLNHICPENVPNEVLFSLKKYFDSNIKRNLFMYGKLIEILDAFHLEGIKSLPYKGPVLAISTYGNLGLREFDDLDIFVHRKDVSKVKNILMSIGYEPRIDLDQKEERKFIQTMRDYIFNHSESGITLEIHWRFPSIFFSLPKSIKLFNWDKCQAGVLQSRQIMISSPEDMLLILCIHNAEHRWKRISLLCDFKQFFITNEINLPRLMRRSKQLGIKRIVAINFYLTNVLLGLELQEEFFRTLISDKNVEKISNHILYEMFSTNTKPTHLLNETLISYKLRENSLFGIKDVIRGVTFPGILEWEKIRLPLFLFPLYYLLRPFLLIKRYMI